MKELVEDVLALIGTLVVAVGVIFVLVLVI